MNRQGRILIMDDEERWREMLSGTLTRGGFLVHTAPTAKEALQRLEETFYHVLVLDLRMEERNPDNFDGMTLLNEIKKRGLNPAIKVIMLSAYGTTEQMRVTFKDYQVVDFVPKDQFDNKVFLENLRQIFLTKVRINLDLAIHWQQGSSAETAVLNMEIAGTRVKRNSPLQQRTALELDDLLCRLFYKAQSIIVQPLIPGLSGARVLQIHPFFSDGGGHSVVVKFGFAEKIEGEHKNFKSYVQSFFGGRRTTITEDVRRTPHLGGIVYSLVGAENERLENFGSFYQRATLSQIASVIDELFLTTCNTWYANPGVLQPRNLTEDYQQLFGSKLERMEQKVSEALQFMPGKHRHTFKSLSGTRTFTNPIQAATGQIMIYPTYVCITHGDFNHNNIFVDTDGHTWLIDFQNTGHGHILRDVAMLDSTIRFQLLETEETTLEECLELEEALNSITRFSHISQLTDKLVTQNPALQKAYDTVVHLRMIARKLVAQNSNDDISEYYAALFYNALNALHFTTLSQRQHEHAMLSASILADRLKLVR